MHVDTEISEILYEMWREIGYWFFDFEIPMVSEIPLQNEWPLTAEVAL